MTPSNRLVPSSTSLGAALGATITDSNALFSPWLSNRYHFDCDLVRRNDTIPYERIAACRLRAALWTLGIVTMSFGRLRLTTQLTILVIATTLITLSVVVLILLARAQTIVEDAIVARNVQLLETTARQLAAAARRSDIVAAREVMAPIPQPGSIRRIALYSMTGIFLNQEIASDMPLGEEPNDEALAREAIATRQIVQRRATNLITLIAPVEDGGHSVGAVAMELPTDDIQRQWITLRETAALVGGVLVMAMALAAWGIARYT